MTPRAPYIDLYDTSVRLWEDADRPGCSQEFWRALTRRAFTPLIRMMRARGWRVTSDPRIDQHHAILRRYHRRATKGELIATIQCHGRVVEIEIWQERHNVTHPNGGRYENYKRRLMPPSLRRLCDLEMDKMAAVLASIAEPHAAPIVDRRRRDEESAVEKIAREYRESWHTDRALGYPPFHNPSDNRGAGGVALTQGQTVWLRSLSGRWERGQAFYRLNSQWMVRLSASTLVYRSAHELHTRPPADPRAKASPYRAARLTALIKAAITAEDYLRAHVLQQVRDGGTPAFRRAS
jgi:hypothetical protein